MAHDNRKTFVRTSKNDAIAAAQAQAMAEWAASNEKPLTATECTASALRTAYSLNVAQSFDCAVIAKTVEGIFDSVFCVSCHAEGAKHA